MFMKYRGDKSRVKPINDVAYNFHKLHNKCCNLESFRFDPLLLSLCPFSLCKLFNVHGTSPNAPFTISVIANDVVAVRIKDRGKRKITPDTSKCHLGAVPR
jgi:hypothetical protein